MRLAEVFFCLKQNFSELEKVDDLLRPFPKQSLNGEYMKTAFQKNGSQFQPGLSKASHLTSSAAGRSWLSDVVCEEDHVKLGRELDLFMTDPTVGRGLPLLTPKGSILKRLLQNFVEQEEIKLGYQFTETPLMAKQELYEISGHWDHYRDDMFVIPGDSQERILALRPMTCPFQFTLYNRKEHSFRELPIRLAETSTLFRNESSGSMHGLTRIRQFTLSEGHIICTPSQLKEEFRETLALIDTVLGVLQLNQYSYRFSKWDPENPGKYIPDPEAWERSQNLLREILDETGIDYVEAPGEAAFYGPKLDIQMKNVWGKEDTIITVQIDFALPQRFHMKYTDSQGKEQVPMVIHRSSIGCYERTMAMLIELHQGRFPFWLAPEQIRILTINSSLEAFAGKLRQHLIGRGLRADIDLRNESLNRKVRDAQLEKIPVILTVGNREKDQGTVSIRTLDGKVRQGILLGDFIEKCLDFDTRKTGNLDFH